MSSEEKRPEDLAIPVREPGEDFDGSFTEAMVSVFGATEEALTAAAEANALTQQAITENQRTAAIKSRTMFMGSSAIH